MTIDHERVLEMEVDQIIKLMEAVSKHDISEVSLEENGSVLTIKKENEVVQAVPTAMPVMMTSADMAVQMPNVAQTAMVSAPAALVPVQTETAASAPEQVTGNVVKSPLVGTFYAASAPGAEPFVKVGDTVKKGQVLGIVEAMKLMNEIESEYDGIVKSILVEDGNLVEYNQEMFIIG